MQTKRFISRACLLALLLLTTFPTVSQAQSGGGAYTLIWSTIDGGGGAGTGGSYSLIGTIGQPDLGYWSQDPYSIGGGFWGNDKNRRSTDVGFRPEPDGYSFANYGGINPDDLTVEDLRTIFGDDAVCSVQFSGDCLYNPAAIAWRNQWVQVMNDGHCYGMAVTSSRFFANVDQPSTFQTNATVTHDLQLASARRNIASYFVRQGANPVSSALSASLSETPLQILQHIRNSFESNSKSLTIAIYGEVAPGRWSGHAVTPYSVVDRENGLAWIMVYDNNHPNDFNRHIEFNTRNNTWSYNIGGTTWNGDAETHSIGIIPYYLNNAIMQCPWCRSSVNTSAANETTQVWAIGDVKMLVTNEGGQRYGYVGDTFVKEIPDATTTVLMTGLREPGPAIYNIPFGDDHTITLDGKSISKPTAMTVSQFGPDYAVTVDGIILSPAKEDKVQIASNGSAVAYVASERKNITMTLALANVPNLSASSATGTTESYSFEISDTQVDANQPVIAAVDSGTGTLTFSNANGSAGVYNLEVGRVDGAGQRTFTYDGISINAGATHYIDYGTWGNTIIGSAPMTIRVDNDSNGTIDDSTQLQQQMNRIYLPLISR